MLSLLAQASRVSMAEAEQEIGVESFGDFVQLTNDIWSEGGWLMWPLFALAVFIFFEAVSLVMRLDRAKLAIPFWWFATAFLSVVFILVSLAAKAPVLRLLGQDFGSESVAGVADYALILAFSIFANPFLWITVLTLKRCQRGVVRQADWEPWIDEPEKAHGHIGEVVSFVAGDRVTEESVDRLEAVRSGLIPDVNQKITVLSSLVTLAPLMGLLGTVIGMLDTFRGLGASSGQAAELVADGIRVALITTQTGLTIAIPGYVFIALAVRSRNGYAVFLTELESSIVRRVHRRKGVAA
jgi:biopolymer transport protein ExbB